MSGPRMAAWSVRSEDGGVVGSQESALGQCRQRRCGGTNRAGVTEPAQQLRRQFWQPDRLWSGNRPGSCAWPSQSRLDQRFGDSIGGHWLDEPVFDSNLLVFEGDGRRVRGELVPLTGLHDRRGDFAVGHDVVLGALGHVVGEVVEHRAVDSTDRQEHEVPDPLCDAGFDDMAGSRGECFVQTDSLVRRKGVGGVDHDVDPVQRIGQTFAGDQVHPGGPGDLDRAEAPVLERGDGAGPGGTRCSDDSDLHSWCSLSVTCG